MTRPPLTLALSSVLAAAVQHGGRPALLATLRPDFGRAPAERGDGEPAHLARVIPMPRVIPLHRSLPEQSRGGQRRGGQRRGEEQHEPDPAA